MLFRLSDSVHQFSQGVLIFATCTCRRNYVYPKNRFLVVNAICIFSDYILWLPLRAHTVVLVQQTPCVCLCDHTALLQPGCFGGSCL